MSSTAQTTALTLLSGFTSLDIPTLLSTRTPTCTHYFAPTSVAIPPKSNDEFAAYVTQLGEVIRSFPVTPKSVIESADGRSIVVWADSEIVWRDEARGGDDEDDEEGGGWEYRGEYVFMFSLTADGKQVEKVVEFLDSKGTDRALGLVQRARANLARRKTAGGG